MERRHFLKQITLASAGLVLPSPPSHTKHLIFVVNCGARKREYYEQISISPNIHRLAGEGFVFEEDHCERVGSHDLAFAELLQGREVTRVGVGYPTILEYIGKGVQLDSIHAIPQVLVRHRPRIVVCRELAHDRGHESYERYLRAVKSTDEAIGRILDWVKRHSYFSQNTAIVIRPEFGRDDEVNEHGHLHHSYGFYYTHRVASIFWGPDFNQGVDRRNVISSLDMAPTLARLFNVSPTYAQGRVVPGLFKTTVGSTLSIPLE
jgi:arylsulfatase A-like enzyme